MFPLVNRFSVFSVPFAVLLLSITPGGASASLVLFAPLNAVTQVADVGINNVTATPSQDAIPYYRNNGPSSHRWPGTSYTVSSFNGSIAYYNTNNLLNNRSDFAVSFWYYTESMSAGGILEFTKPASLKSYIYAISILHDHQWIEIHYQNADSEPMQRIGAFNIVKLGVWNFFAINFRLSQGMVSIFNQDYQLLGTAAFPGHFNGIANSGLTLGLGRTKYKSAQMRNGDGLACVTLVKEQTFSYFQVKNLLKTCSDAEYLNTPLREVLELYLPLNEYSAVKDVARNSLPVSFGRSNSSRNINYRLDLNRNGPVGNFSKLYTRINGSLEMAKYHLSKEHADSFSISLYYNFTNLQNYDGVLELWPGDYDLWPALSIARYGNTMEIYANSLRTSPSSHYVTKFDNVFNTMTWTFVTLIYNKTGHSLSVYKNGVFHDSALWMKPLVLGKQFSLGYSHVMTTAYGMLDSSTACNILIHRKALSAYEVGLVYKSVIQIPRVSDVSDNEILFLPFNAQANSSDIAFGATPIFWNSNSLLSDSSGPFGNNSTQTSMTFSYASYPNYPNDFYSGVGVYYSTRLQQGSRENFAISLFFNYRSPYLYRGLFTLSTEDDKISLIMVFNKAESNTGYTSMQLFDCMINSCDSSYPGITVASYQNNTLLMNAWNWIIVSYDKPTASLKLCSSQLPAGNNSSVYDWQTADKVCQTAQLAAPLSSFTKLAIGGGRPDVVYTSIYPMASTDDVACISVYDKVLAENEIKQIPEICQQSI